MLQRYLAIVKIALESIISHCKKNTGTKNKEFKTSNFEMVKLVTKANNKIHKSKSNNKTIYDFIHSWYS